MNFLHQLKERITTPMPVWFKTIAALCSILAIVCGALWIAQDTNQICLPPVAYEWMKRIAIAAGAVAGVSATSMENKKFDS